MNNLNKLAAVAYIKFLGISKNTAIMIGPLLTIAMVYGCRILYGLNNGGRLSPILVSILLNLGISMNICMDGFVMVGTAIAEEKEKHTLRVLMTSSVTGMQYFFGSILMPFLITFFVNFIVLWIAEVPFAQINLAAFIVVNLLASLTSCVIGMIVGIFAKNQMNANLISYPLMIVFMMFPIFGNLSKVLNNISSFLFTGVMTEMTECFAKGKAYMIKPLDIAVLVGELIISALIFLTLYQRDGYEKD